MENASTAVQRRAIVTSDGGKDRDSPEARGEHALRAEAGFLPRDVASRVFGPDSGRAARLEGARLAAADKQPDLARREREAIVASGLLPSLPHLRTIDAKGTEHAVRFRGMRVEKHQHSDCWVPVITPDGKLGLDHSLPTEYLRRLDLQNELFGDDIRVIGLTPGHRFAISQSTLRGGEPGENEIRDVLEQAGWRRIPIGIQDLPPQLMGSAWWHPEEEVVLLDARKPNFKKTAFGVLPIDLILADLAPEMRRLFDTHPPR
jgi:hypothetical protein